MATKKQQTVATLPATVDKITQEDLPSLLKVINQKISELQGDDKEDGVVASELPGFGRISDIKDPMVLRLAYSTVAKKAEAVDKYNDVFKAVAPTIPVKNFKEGGNSTEQWQKAILSQYKKVVFKEELSKLEKAKEKIQANLSQNDRMRADLADVFKDLNVDSGE